MKNRFKHVLMMVAAISLTQQVVAQGDATAGEAKSAMCSACHGSDGNSAVPNFPKLAGLGEKYIFKQLQDIKSGKRQVVEMSGILTALSDQDMKDIAAYYSSKSMQLSGAKEIKVRLNSGEEVDGLKLGTQVYRSGNMESGVPACTGCHSPRGLGNAPAGYPRLSGQFAAYVEKQLRAFRGGERTNDGEAQIMRKVAERMTDSEIVAVSNYISGLN